MPEAERSPRGDRCTAAGTLGTPRSADRARHTVLGTGHSALGAPCSVPSTWHSALRRGIIYRKIANSSREFFKTRQFATLFLKIFILQYNYYEGCPMPEAERSARGTHCTAPGTRRSARGPARGAPCSAPGARGARHSAPGTWHSRRSARCQVDHNRLWLWLQPVWDSTKWPIVRGGIIEPWAHFNQLLFE